LNESRLKRFKQVLLSYRGSVPLHMIVVHDQDKVRMPFGQDFLVNPTPQLAAKINEVFQGNSVQFVVDGKLEDVGNTQI